MSGGYGKPPRHSQFKPGQSGNPRGRPRRAAPAEPLSDSEFDRMLREGLDTEVAIKDGARGRRIRMSEAVLRSTLASAAKGNPLAQRIILTMQQDLELREAARRLAEEEANRQSVAFARRIKAEQARAWEAAEARGEKPARLYPHPADIVISSDGLKWSCNGPWDENDLPRYERYWTLLEVAWYRWAYSWSRLGRDNFLTKFFEILILPYAALIPTSWLDRVEPEITDTWIGLSLRELRKQLIVREERAALSEKVMDALDPPTSETNRAVEKELRWFVQLTGQKSLKACLLACDAAHAARPAHLRKLPYIVAWLDEAAEKEEAKRLAKRAERLAAKAQKTLPQPARRSTPT